MQTLGTMDSAAMDSADFPVHSVCLSVCLCYNLRIRPVVPVFRAEMKKSKNTRVSFPPVSRGIPIIPALGNRQEEGVQPGLHSEFPASCDTRFSY